jgi:long-subunit acyl-CoA synthetase (AMP-forming)
MTIIAPAANPAPAVPASEHATLCAAFQATAAAYGERVALRTPGGGVRVTWAEYAGRVQDTAARLATVGVGPGDTVALLLTMRPEVAWVDAAAMHLGAAGLSLYLAGTAAAHAYVLDDADVRVLVTERSLAGLAPALRRACPKLEHVIAIDGDAPGVTALDELAPAPGFDLEEAAAAVRPDDRITLMYTSGTTGAPKGVVYSHRRILAAFAGFDSAVPATEWLHAVAFLPFAHAGQRAFGHYRSLLHGSTTTFCPDPAQLPAAIADARPTVLFAPPGVWQRLADGADAALAADPAARAAHTRALASVRRGDAPTPSPELAAVRARLGLDRLDQPFVSAAQSAPEMLQDIHALGVPLMNTYALTELPLNTITRPHPADIGTAGRPLPGVEVRLGDDGEVLVRHHASCAGFHRRPSQTAAMFDDEGWAHTGDVGLLDAEGRLTLDGRRDERFATAYGTNIDPVRIEMALRAECPDIAEACVIGDGRPYLVALLTLKGDLAAVAAAVERVNAQLPETGRIQRYAVLEDTWAPGSDELTPTLKLRRTAVQSRYADHIEALYAGS